MSAEKTSFLATITAEQAAHLAQLLREQQWEFDTAPYAHWRARRQKTTIVAYESGKLVVQGKGTAEVVQFTIEPQVLGEARFGYEEVWAKEEHPEMFAPHAGVDESGKGDFFGPMVIAAAYVDERTAPLLLKDGVQDSKKIKSEARIVALAGRIREVTGNRVAVVTIGPEAYNRLHTKMGSVNQLLAWGHARAIEDLLVKVPACPRAISDQFGDKRLIERALMAKGRQLKLEQMHKAEADVAVAAASIIARHEFVRRLAFLGEALGVTLPKGASRQVLETAAEVIRQHGEPGLARIAKLHFHTAIQARALAAGLPLPPKPPSRYDWRRGAPAAKGAAADPPDRSDPSGPPDSGHAKGPP